MQFYLPIHNDLLDYWGNDTKHTCCTSYYRNVIKLFFDIRFLIYFPNFLAAHLIVNYTFKLFLYRLSPFVSDGIYSDSTDNRPTLYVYKLDTPAILLRIKLQNSHIS